MTKKMKKTERKASTRLVPDSEEPTQAILRYSSYSTELQPPAGLISQPSNARDSVDTHDKDNVLLQDVARLVDKNIIEAERRAAEKKRKSTHSKAAIVSSIALLASVLLIAALLLWKEIHAGGGNLGPLCDTNDCLRFAYIIIQSMDRGADACNAFGKYVCGGAPRPPLSAWMPDARDNLLHRWTSKVIESLAATNEGGSAKKGTRILDDARAMLQSCVEEACDPAASERNARDLRMFLEQRKLSWPGDPQRLDVHPLDVLLDLAINWQMPLWFNIGILNTAVTASALRVDFSVDSNRWWLPVGNTYLSPSPTTDSPESNSSRTATPVRQDNAADTEIGDMHAYHFDNYVLSTLSKLASGYSAGLEPSAIDLADIEALTPHLKAEQWMVFLQRHMGSAMIISDSTQVLVADRRLLATTDNFFDKYFHTELLAHVSRSIVNAFANVMYSAVSTDDPHSALNDSGPCPTAAVKTRCELQVEYTYRLPLAVHHAHCHGMPTRRSRLVAILNEALRAAVAALVHLKGPTSTERRHGSLDATIYRLQRIHLDVWPSDKLVNKPPHQLEDMYANFPKLDAAHSYMEHLLATRRALRSLLGSANYSLMTGMGSQGGRSRDGLFGYDPFTNAVSVWPGAMDEPLFYARATNAINYGGVGAAFARQLTAAMDVDEVHLDFGSGSWIVHHRDRANITEDDLIAERRALGIAHDAYVDHVLFEQGGSWGPHIVSLEEFTSEQIFFISYCHSLCQLSPIRGPERCASAVKGFHHFREAFSCNASHR